MPDEQTKLTWESLSQELAKYWPQGRTVAELEKQFGSDAKIKQLADVMIAADELESWEKGYRFNIGNPEELLNDAADIIEDLIPVVEASKRSTHAAEAAGEFLVKLNRWQKGQTVENTAKKPRKKYTRKGSKGGMGQRGWLLLAMSALKSTKAKPVGTQDIATYLEMNNPESEMGDKTTVQKAVSNAFRNGHIARVDIGTKGGAYYVTKKGEEYLEVEIARFNRGRGGARKKAA